MHEVYIFQASNETISDFSSLYLVQCPQCYSCARVIIHGSEDTGIFAPRRLICSICGLTRDWKVQAIHFGDEYDSYFRLPLWLRISVGSHILWAYNERHLQLIEDFVRAKQRKRKPDSEVGWCNQSVISRLPQWVIEAQKRERILKAIERLKERIILCNIRN